MHERGRIDLECCHGLGTYLKGPENDRLRVGDSVI